MGVKQWMTAVVVAGMCGVAGVFGLMAGSPEAQNTPSGGLRVAVIDIDRAMQGARVLEFFQDDMNRQLQGYRDQSEALRKSIGEIRAELAAMDDSIGAGALDSRETEARERQLKRLREEFELLRDHTTRRHSELQAHYGLMLLAAVMEVIERVAKEERCHIVLRRPALRIQAEEPEEASDAEGEEAENGDRIPLSRARQSLAAALQQATVLYADRESQNVVDITAHTRELLRTVNWEELRPAVHRRLGLPDAGADE